MKRAVAAGADVYAVDIAIVEEADKPSDFQKLLAACDRKDGLSLFDLTSGASTAPTADADSTVRSHWLTRDVAARLAVRNHLPSTERAHFSQYKSARALYDAVVARYSSPTTAALSRLMLPYLFPDLAAFSTVADLVAHLRTSDARYRAALPTAFLPTNSPPMYITLYYLYLSCWGFSRRPSHPLLSHSLRAASPSVTRFLATAVTDPMFESSTAFSLIAELVDFAAACRLDYAASLAAESASVSVCPPSVGGECALGTDVLEDRQEDLECFAAASPHLVSMLLAPEGDPDALDIPTPRSYPKAIEGPYSS
ncbi:unnamed protein product [Closterium sp. NIES-54]